MLSSKDNTSPLFIMQDKTPPNTSSATEYKELLIFKDFSQKPTNIDSNPFLLNNFAPEFAAIYSLFQVLSSTTFCIVQPTPIE